MLTNKIPYIAISIGDYNGIGPEIILKTLVETDLNNSIPVIIAPKEVVEFYVDQLPIENEFQYTNSPENFKEGSINVLTFPAEELKITPGIQSAQSGKTAMHSIEKAIELCMAGKTHAMVTAPISKEAVNLAGYEIPGHTEFLASKTNTSSVLMMLVSGGLRVALATTHIPVKHIAENISKELIKAKLKLLANSLTNDFGINNPKIAVFGLNPHAGDGGVIGSEEIDIISPAVKELNKEPGIFEASGPFPADGFFGQQLYKKFDAILAMYHDQGLAPFKLLSFGEGVNFTAGLPIIRTSPDHGTAFDIAGKGIANPSSFKEAYKLAVQLANRRLREG